MAEWMIPVRVAQEATAYVTADTPHEALERARNMDWHDMDLGEMVDWEVRGEPEPNE